ncbi:Serine/threonine-protein phosphatase 6 regulatory ankyrin repeat subunit B [Durusdinium trenchii]|uniref:Serine/threonine-protein phosphatase 6 regulatory ankyrin repeat subunit B n=1 Tax=Durusdinium trenchii TaxID=1381693 RepID=A0ABP0K3E3_9DINO
MGAEYQRSSEEFALEATSLRQEFGTELTEQQQLRESLKSVEAEKEKEAAKMANLQEECDTASNKQVAAETEEYQRSSEEFALEVTSLRQELGTELTEQQQLRESLKSVEAEKEKEAAKMLSVQQECDSRWTAMVRQEGLVESLRRELQARELRVSEEQDRSSSLLKAEQDCREIFESLEAKLAARGENVRSSSGGGGSSGSGDQEQLQARVQEQMRLLQQTEIDLRRAIAAHRYVVRHMVSTPGVHAAMAPAAASTADEEEEGREELRVKLWSPSSGRECQDFLFGVPARRMSASTVAWLRGSETG